MIARELDVHVAKFPIGVPVSRLAIGPHARVRGAEVDAVKGRTVQDGLVKDEGLEQVALVSGGAIGHVGYHGCRLPSRVIGGHIAGADEHLVIVDHAPGHDFRAVVSHPGRMGILLAVGVEVVAQAVEADLGVGDRRAVEVNGQGLAHVDTVVGPVAQTVTDMVGLMGEGLEDTGVHGRGDGHIAVAVIVQVELHLAGLVVDLVAPGGQPCVILQP